MEPQEPNLPELTPQCLSHVFSFLASRDAGRASSVQKHWRELVQQDNALWQRLLREDLGLTDQRGAEGVQLPSFWQAYRSWRTGYGPELWPFLVRALRAWGTIKAWLLEHYPEIHATLRPGASEAQVAAVEEDLGFSLPPALRVLYRLVDGQALAFDAKLDAPASARTAAATAAEVASIFHGLLGGYAVYDHMAVGRLLGLERAARWTRELKLSQLRPSLLLFAASFRVHEKPIMVDCETGGVFVLRRLSHAQAVAAGNKPVVLQPAAPPDCVPGARDGALRWLEEFASRLAGGVYGVAQLDEEHPVSRAISLFPEKGPHLAEAVTRGVRVRASCVYCPETGPRGRHFFAYSIRFSLDSPEEQLARMHRGAAQGAEAQQARRAAGAEAEPAGPEPAGPEAAGGGAGGVVRSCQLRTRHWVIRNAAGGVEDEVRGEGVIGKYPLLRPGEPEFVYQSCTHQAEERGSMEGSFAFVEGSLEQPAAGLGGAEGFDAVCPRFRLDVPEYIY